MLPLARVRARGPVPAPGLRRGIARLGPVPLLRPGHCCRDVAGTDAGTTCPRGSLLARVAPRPLCGSMLSQTPEARQFLAFACPAAWLARQSRRSAGTPSLPCSGLWGRGRASTPHRAQCPQPKQRFRASWIPRSRAGGCEATIVGILLFVKELSPYSSARFHCFSIPALLSHNDNDSLHSRALFE